MVKPVTEHDDRQAEGILQFMLQKGRASRKQVAWLIGYFRRVRPKDRPQETVKTS